jgi:hypothetical protein
MKKVILTLLAVLVLASVAAADTIYLRDGRSLRGTLLGFINGRFAFRLYNARSSPTGATTANSSTGVVTSRDDGEIQFFRPNEVDRVEIDGRSLDDLRFETRAVEVTLGPNWIDSGIDVLRNERVQINASGTIVAGRTRITPDGLRSSDVNAPLPRAPEGLLIGAIGNDPNSPVLELGSSREFVADRDGRLYLTANRSSYTDARGAFTVQIRRERDLTAMRDDGNQVDNPFGGGRNDRGPNRPRTRQPTNVYPVNRNPQEVTIDVAAISRGTDTNIDAHAGDQITLTATGTVIAGRRVGEVGPEGGRTSGFGALVGTRPVPTSGPGALIGYIRLADGQISQPFLVGNQLILTVPADGRLFLAINDDDYSDNAGSFKVKIKY